MIWIDTLYRNPVYDCYGTVYARFYVQTARECRMKEQKSKRCPHDRTLNGWLVKYCPPRGLNDVPSTTITLPAMATSSHHVESVVANCGLVMGIGADTSRRRKQTGR